MKNHKYLPLKGVGKVHFYSLARKCRSASFYLHKNLNLKKVRKTAKNKTAFHHRKKLPYLFTIHYYLLLSKKIRTRRISEK